MRFGDRELEILKALGEAALPPGRLLPAPGEAAFRRLEALLSEGAPAVFHSYRAGLWSLELGTVARRGARFSALPFGRRLEVLDGMAASPALRLALRGLLLPLKISHYDDPGLHAALGCRFEVEKPRALEPARWRSQLSEAGALPDGEALECDVVIVGSGAGGAPLAKKLAERGHAVLILEEGPHLTRLDFTGRPMEMMKKAYRKRGLTVALGNAAIPIPVGRAVGGTTVVNSGTCFRLPEATLAEWRDEHGLEGFTQDALAPFYEEAERFLEAGPSSKRALGRPAELVARGCDALGYSHHALVRNAPGCDGQGLCCFGCPTDAKRSANVSWIPAALDRGAQLLTGFQVEHVLVERETAVGVSGVARDAEGRPVRLTVRARVVVLACGTLSTPLVLLRDGLGNASDQVGRNLSIHPATAAIGVFDEPLAGWNTVPQGYAIDEFADEGIMFEGAHVPLDLTAGAVSSHGPAFTALMEKYDRTVGFGFMVKDRSRGRVGPGKDGEPRISYWLGDHDVAKLRRGTEILARVFFAAGAREVWPAVFGFERLRGEEDVKALSRASLAARDFDLTAYHPLGTCRMGADPLRSVVGPTGETHDVHNLFVCDGSALPSSLGVNPQLTIMALALRASAFVDRRLERLARAAA